MASIAGRLLSMAEQLSPMRRFYKFVVRRLIGPYIKYDLDLEQLEIKLGEGMVKLCDVQLNPIAFNAMLSQSGTNLRISSGTIAELRITIPWRNLMNQSCQVSVHGVQAVLSIGAEAYPTGVYEQPGETIEEEMIDEENVSEGIQVLERWIEGVISRLQLSVHDLSVRLDHCTGESQEYSSLALTLQQLEYRDTTAEDLMMSNSGIGQSEVALVKAKEKKEVKFHGLQLTLNQERDGGDPVLCTGVHSDRDDYVCISIEKDQVDLSFFLQTIQCRITSPQMPVLAEMLAALLDTAGLPDAPPSPNSIAQSSSQLCASLKPGDFRKIEHILSVHEGVDLNQLEQSVYSPSVEESRMFYSSIGGDADVFSSFMGDSVAFGAAPEVGNEEAAEQWNDEMRPLSRDSRSLSVSCRLHVEHLGVGVGVVDGRGLLMESKLVSSIWQHAGKLSSVPMSSGASRVGGEGLHCDLKLSPIKVYQSIPQPDDPDNLSSKETILVFGAVHDLEASSFVSFMQDSTPHLHLHGEPSSLTGTTHFQLESQHMLASFDPTTLQILREIAAAGGEAAGVYERHCTQPAEADPQQPGGTFGLSLPSLELNYEQLRLSLEQLCVSLEPGGGIKVEMESADLKLLMESDEGWSRIPVTVVAARGTEGQPIQLEIRNSKQPTAEWCPGEGMMSHDATARHAIQAEAVAASPVLIHASLAHCDLTFSTTTYNLLLSLLLGAPTELPDHNPGEELAAAADAECTTGLGWCLLVNVHRSHWTLAETEAPEVARSHSLPDKSPAEYTADIENISVFFIQEQQSRSWLSGQFGKLDVWEARAGHEKRCVLRASPRFSEMDLDSQAPHVLSLLCGFNTEENTDQVEILFRDLIYQYHVGSLWVLRVQEFLVPSKPADTEQPPLDRPALLTKLTLRIEKISVHHQPLLHRAGILLHVASAEMSTTLVDQCPDVVLWTEIAAAQGFITSRADSLSKVLKDRLAYKESLSDVLSMHSAVQIMNLTHIEATITISDDAPMLAVDVRNPKAGELKVSLCADSCCELASLVEHWIDAVDVGGLVLLEPLAEETGYGSDPMAESMLIALLGEIDPYAFVGPAEAEEAEGSDVSVRPSQNVPFLIDDFYQGPRSHVKPNRSRTAGGCSAGWIEPPVVIDDYFNTRNVDNEAMKGLGVMGELDEDINYPRVVCRITLTGVNATAELFGGFDWVQQLPSSTVDAFMPRPDCAQPDCTLSESIAMFGRDNSTVLRLEVKSCMARYWEFEPRTTHSWRLAISAQDVELYDCLTKSTWKKFLTRSRRHGEHHGNRSMLKLEIDALHPDPDKLVEDWNFKLELVPLKLNIDQDALDFLVAFLSFESDAWRDEDVEPSATVPIFFQCFELGQLQVCIDYKAKHFDLNKVHDGHYEELANLLSLEGMELSLGRVRLNGISGWADIGTGVLCEWAPSIWESQIHRYAQSVQPIRTLANVASGMFDLIYLPLCDDRSVLRGAQRGTASCAWKVSLEVMSMAARMAVTTQIALEHVRDAVVPGAQNQTSSADPVPQLGQGYMRSKFSNGPGGVAAGLKEAYNSLSHGFKMVANSLVKRSGRGRQSVQQGYAASLLQGVLGVGISTAEAASKVLIGARNSLDPTNKFETSDKYK